jgi:hypothetical protein
MSGPYRLTETVHWPFYCVNILSVSTAGARPPICGIVPCITASRKPVGMQFPFFCNWGGGGGFEAQN